MIRKLIIKFTSLAILVIALNFIYQYLFFEKDLQEHAAIINLVRDIPDSADILYIAASSNISFRPNDIDKRPISAFLGDHYPGLNVYDITKPASHSGVFKVLLEKIPGSSQIQTLVVTMNLRSFNAQWIYSELETPLQKSLVLLRPYPPVMNRFLLSFKAYDIKTDKEREQQFINKWEKDIFHFPYDFPHSNVQQWNEWMATRGIRNKDESIDYDLTALACNYIKAYGFQIDTLSNPRIGEFNDIVELARSRGWNLVFNILAENTEKAAQLVGKDLIYLMEENTSLLKEYYGRKGVVVVDNLAAVADSLFIDQNWTTEHYAEEGRKTIAGNVAMAVQTFHPVDFTEVEYKFELQSEFFNNCDQSVIWGQMESITEELSFSGDRSSLTGNGNDYGIGFMYPLKVIPDSIKNEINISVMIYQEAIDHDAVLVIQAEGKNFEKLWQGIGFKDQVTEINTWQQFHAIYTIPDEIKNAELIKIYMFNPSNTRIFVDDFKIEFI